MPQVPLAVGFLALNGHAASKMPSGSLLTDPPAAHHHPDPMKHLSPPRPMSAHWLWALGLCAGLAGCGPDTVGAAATAAKLQADSAERAQAQAAQLKQELEAAVKAREASTAAADR